MSVTARTKQHPHDDAPDTAAAFERLHALPDRSEDRAEDLFGRPQNEATVFLYSLSQYLVVASQGVARPRGAALLGKDRETALKH